MRWPKNMKWKLVLLFLYGCLLVAWTWLELPCVIRWITGCICPGCGMSRAWLALLQMNWKAAFSLHPMFWSVPLLFLYILYDGALFRNHLLNNWILGTVLGGFALCYIIRLIIYLGGNLTI